MLLNNKSVESDCRAVVDGAYLTALTVKLNTFNVKLNYYNIYNLIKLISNFCICK